jgi:hypothetical protein
LSRDALYDAVKTILMQDWDPIGVSDVAAAQDEYNPYVGPLVTMLRRNASIEMITAYLDTSRNLPISARI